MQTQQNLYNKAYIEVIYKTDIQTTTAYATKSWNLDFTQEQTQ